MFRQKSAFMRSLKKMQLFLGLSNCMVRGMGKDVWRNMFQSRLKVEHIKNSLIHFNNSENVHTFYLTCSVLFPLPKCWRIKMHTNIMNGTSICFLLKKTHLLLSLHFFSFVEIDFLNTTFKTAFRFFTSKLTFGAVNNDYRDKHSE